MCTHEYTVWYGGDVQQIGARELRANLAAALRQAGAGQRVVVTVDGRPVAQLGPLEPTGTPALEELAAAGLLEPPRRSRPTVPAGLDTAVDVRLDRILDEVRGS
jgi:prevent-host-death family protein